MVNVKIENLSKSYDGKQNVLNNISVTIGEGELFFLLGPSGCGKSTLLRLIAGFIQTDKGAIHFNDDNITSLAVEKRKTGMVFQNYALWPHMTVYDNVAFGLTIQGIKGAEADERIMKTLDQVGLREYAQRKPTELSGGQQQRVALGRAMIIRPRVLLLDEPLSNLDAKLRASMRSEIRDICKQAELTTIYVTHDQKEALSMADRIAVLDNGIIQQVGTPYEIYNYPCNKFVADFIGEANLIAGSVLDVNESEVSIKTELGVLKSTVSVSGFQANDAVVLVLRPESLQLKHSNQGSNCFDATIDSGKFQGENSQWILSANQQTLSCLEQNPLPRKIGESCTCYVDPQNVIVIKD